MLASDLFTITGRVPIKGWKLDDSGPSFSKIKNVTGTKILPEE